MKTKIKELHRHVGVGFGRVEIWKLNPTEAEVQMWRKGKRQKSEIVPLKKLGLVIDEFKKTGYFVAWSRADA